MSSLKIAIIGGGSSYTPELVEGLIQRIEELPVTELALVDVEPGREKVAIIAALTRRMLARNGLEQVKVSVHFDLDEAIRGAKFVLTQLRVGQLPARAADERLGLKYRLIGQETTGIGGFAKALRTIPVMLNIARKVEQLAPSAWIINFTNPAGIVTEAVSRYTQAKIIGLCNVPISMHHMIANMLQAPYDQVQLQFAGLNHMVWVHQVLHNGQNVTANVIDMLCDGATLTMNNIKEEPWPPEFLRAVGAIPCPYHRYFYQTQQMLAEETTAAAERGTRAEQVMKVEKELFELYADPHLDSKPEQLSFRGGSFYSEVALELIRAIHNNLGTQLVVNTANRGAIRGLPDDAVIETNCIVDAQGAHPLAFGRLPESMHALTQQVKAYERLTIEAAVHGDRRSALLALVTNPLIANAQIAQPLLDEVLEANQAYLPNADQLSAEQHNHASMAQGVAPSP
ncbi:MAG: 6-phospho-beta-glucosidase [Chania sp.]